jgi:hypothetical protein
VLNRTPEWQAWVYDNSLAAGVFRRKGNFNPRKAAAGHAMVSIDPLSFPVRAHCSKSSIYWKRSK